MSRKEIYLAYNYGKGLQKYGKRGTKHKNTDSTALCSE